MDAAQKNLVALVRLSAKQTPEPLIICQLIRQACAALSFNATWQALQAEGWSDAQLASLEAAWEPCNLAKDSVGEDGKDDDGDPTQRDEKKSYRQIWDGRDAVWPSAATAEEAKPAVGAKKHE